MLERLSERPTQILDISDIQQRKSTTILKDPDFFHDRGKCWAASEIMRVTCIRERSPIYGNVVVSMLQDQGGFVRSEGEISTGMGTNCIKGITRVELKSMLKRILKFGGLYRGIRSVIIFLAMEFA